MGALLTTSQYDVAGQLTKQFTTDSGGDSGWSDVARLSARPRLKSEKNLSALAAAPVEKSGVRIPHG